METTPTADDDAPLRAELAWSDTDAALIRALVLEDLGFECATEETAARPVRADAPDPTREREAWDVHLNIQAVLQPRRTTADVLERMRDADLTAASPMLRGMLEILRDQLAHSLHDGQTVH